MLMNRLPRREIARQLPPLAACLHHIQHRVHHPALFMLARSTAGVTPCTWFVQQRLQPHPLLVGQIARVHAPTLSTQTLSAYSFQGSFASFWTGSYNITSLTAAMRKALNRERTNVGRTAYSDRVKQMLLAFRADAVVGTLAADLQRIELGTNRDEVKWTDVAVHACQILNASKKVVFVTASELTEFRSAIDHAREDGLRIVTVPENIKDALEDITDLKGNPVRDLSVFQSEWSESFEFKFVSSDRLTNAERKIFDLRDKIAALVGSVPKKVQYIKISETMRPDFFTGSTTQGLWDEASRSIIILRKQLGSLSDFAGTLLHEIAHAKTGYDDVSREFESALTEMLGKVAALRM